jgi:hypothetical protein
MNKNHERKTKQRQHVKHEKGLSTMNMISIDTTLE